MTPTSWQSSPTVAASRGCSRSASESPRRTSTRPSSPRRCTGKSAACRARDAGKWPPTHFLSAALRVVCRLIRLLQHQKVCHAGCFLWIQLLIDGCRDCHWCHLPYCEKKREKNSVGSRRAEEVQSRHSCLSLLKVPMPLKLSASLTTHDNFISLTTTLL